MNKKIMTMLLAVCIGIIPIQAFGATRNHIPYISKSKIDEVTSTQVIVDNTCGDLRPGQYFTVRLENAEFELDDDGEVNMRSSSFELTGSSKHSIYGTLKEGAPDTVSFSFYSKILGDEARVIIDPEDSGITGGSYLYAATGGVAGATIGKIEDTTPMYFDTSLEVPPIIIKEQSEAGFRSVQMYNTSDEALITFRPKSDLFKIRSSDSYHNITFVVDDGKGNSHRYELGRDSEVEFDYDKNKISFKTFDDDIFDQQGQVYTIAIENVEVSLKDKDKKTDHMELVFGGLLLKDQTTIIGKGSLEPLSLKATEEKMVPGSKQIVKFILNEQHPNTLFEEGYLNLGIFGGGIIDSKSDLTFTLKDGVNTYSQNDKDAFKLEFDPIGDRVTIRGYRRNNKANVLTLEGELGITVAENQEKDIEFFISEPSLTKAVKQRVLTRPEEIISPPKPEKPETPETPEPSLPTYSKVEFTEGSNHYKQDGVSHPLDAKAYISKHNRIMVPVRYLAPALGAEDKDLKWDGNTGIITIKGEDDITIDTIKNQVARKSIITTLSDIEIVEGRTFVPVGEIGKALEMKVYWNGESRTATFN